MSGLTPSYCRIELLRYLANLGLGLGPRNNCVSGLIVVMGRLGGLILGVGVSEEGGFEFLSS
jgi:hypothetical protein